MKFLPYILIVILAVTTVVAIVTRPDQPDIYKPSKDQTQLSERINAACKTGYHVIDWTTGDQFDPLPAGTVQVTCGQDNGKYGTYVVAVSR